MSNPVTPQRMREIALLLLQANKRYTAMAQTSRRCAADVERDPSLSPTSAPDYRKAADEYDEWAKQAGKAALELQDHSFTMKG